MSFQDYVDHISQKYRLAVAISVIKTKPDNLSIDEYLTQLQNKIKNEENDPNETVCSDDFNFDDDDILKEKIDENTKTDILVLNENRLDYSINENNSEGSQTILHDFFVADGRLEVGVGGETSIGDTLRLLKEVATATQEEDNANQNISQLTFCESQEAINIPNNDAAQYYESNINATEDNNKCITNRNENNNIDSQETQLYSLHGFTQDYNHVSQTQNEYFVIPDKYIRNIANQSNYVQENSKEINGAKRNETQMCITGPNVLSQNIFAITVDGRECFEKTCVPQQAMETDCGNTKPSQSVSEVKEFTANNVDTDIPVNKNVNELKGCNIDNTQKYAFNNVNAVLPANRASDNSYPDEAIINVNRCNEIMQINTTTKTNKATDNEPGTPVVSFNSQNTVHNEIQKVGIEHKKNNPQKSQEDIRILTEKIPINIENVQECNHNTENNDMEIDESESEDNGQETVPFKVIEEMNRVKNYVSKKDKRYDGYSTDSGYRSDSQARSSLKTSSQSHGAWLNQSAHCLFSYILQTTATDDIVKQIAQVLGKLIDRLHEEENYPPFLEELLGSVDSMLMDLRVGAGWSDHVLLIKDETIQRLLLLNKSKHIIKYSIEKITETLEQLHTNLTQEELYELTNLDESENICYILHILEILLKKYMKVKDVTSQSTQNSQDSLQTRSSLTELWRKKWYPNSKETIKNENKICILKRCSVILNKIIVECMDGYSLVAFAALQCFNVIQS